MRRVGETKNYRTDDGEHPHHFIAEWRQYRGWSQAELAKRCGYSFGRISHLETGSGKYTQPIIEALAEALECTPADLLDRLPSPEADQRNEFHEVFLKLAPDKQELMRVVMKEMGRWAPPEKPA